jgi:aldehyde:ferredoxin oxidoreductase
LGAKNLKGIAVHGSIPVPVADPRGLVESHGVFIDSLCRPNPSLLDRVERNLACADPDAEELWEKEVRFLRLKRIACWSCQISCRRVVLGRAGGSGFHCSIPEMLDLLRAYSGNGGLGTEDVVTLAALCADLGLDAAAAGRSAKLRPGDSGWERESIARWFEETARGGGGGLGPSGLPGNEDREPGGDDSVLILDMAGACRQAHCFWKGWEVWERGIAPIFEQATGVSLGAADVEEICTRVREAEGELRRPGTGTGDRA